MDSDEFRILGKEMIDITANYLDTIETRRVLPNVEPGYLRKLVPDHAPFEPDQWKNIVEDIENVIMPGVTHWHSPNFHAYYPTANSYPAILGEILSNAISCIGFSWVASPACTELELVTMDWLAKALNLPDFYLNSKNGAGGGIFQNSTSESSFIALLAARNKKIQEIKEQSPDLSVDAIKSKLVAYVSQEAHSSCEKATMLSDTFCKKLPTDENFSVRGETFQKIIDEDKKNGLIPFYLIATLGTTSICSYDNLKELGPICKKEKIWLNVDAAYAGSALICPEFRHLMQGIEYTDSFVFNPNKWLRVNFDCTAFWIKDKKYLIENYGLNPSYLNDRRDDSFDLRHWSVSFGRKFRSLKLWFVFRMFGIKGLQEFIRKHVSLAKYFEKLMSEDDRFEIVGKPTLGLVCFRLKGSKETNQRLLKLINEEGLIYMISSQIKDLYFIRFVVCSALTEETHIKFAFDVISKNADKITELEWQAEA